VVQALTTEAIAECIRNGGVWEAEMNIDLLADAEYSRVRTEEFTVVGTDRPPPAVFHDILPRIRQTSEVSDIFSSVLYFDPFRHS
jgi:hypothetical protein